MGKRRVSKVGSEFEGCALAYTRVSTGMQAEAGSGLEAQRRTIEGYAIGAGYGSVRWLADAGVSGKIAPEKREGLSFALDLLDRGEACALIVSKLDRLCRSVRDLLALVDRADLKGWRLVVLDMNVDTGSSVGRMTLTILGAVAEFERARIAERCAESAAVRKSIGVRLGRHSASPDDLRSRVLGMRTDGMTLQGIADRLNAEGVATLRGSAGWRTSSVASLVKTAQLDAEALANRAT